MAAECMRAWRTGCGAVCACVCVRAATMLCPSVCVACSSTHVAAHASCIRLPCMMGLCCSHFMAVWNFLSCAGQVSAGHTHSAFEMCFWGAMQGRAMRVVCGCACCRGLDIFVQSHGMCRERV